MFRDEGKTVERRKQREEKPLCIATFVATTVKMLTRTLTKWKINEFNLCATLAQKMEALKEKRRYFMQFSLKDDCVHVSTDFSFSLSLYLYLYLSVCK